jgi:ATP-dependent Clp protease adaptor protein ClpS
MTKENLKEENISKEKLTDNRFLILHNDEVNTFDFVIESLVDICNHNEIQAEQCAFITHFKGKCDVKKGDIDSLKPLKDKLISKGLSVTID